MAFSLFGFKLIRDKEEGEVVTFVQPEITDDIGEAKQIPGMTAEFGVLSAFSNNNGNISVQESENNLISQYREIARNPEVDKAIEEIVSEAIVADEKTQSIKLDLSDVDLSDTIKEKMHEAFKKTLRLLNFNQKGFDIFRRWYIDGRINYHIIIDEKNLKRGVVQLRYIDPKKIKRIRTPIVDKDKDVSWVEFYEFNENGIDTQNSTQQQANQKQTLKISVDSIAHANSGLTNAKNNIIISYLDKAIAPANKLRSLENSMIIYRLVRAPERRLIYVDVGQLPKHRADQYMQSVIGKYKTKITYDTVTGKIRDDRNIMALTEDYFIPRQGGCFSLDTKIKLLDGRDESLETLIAEYDSGKQNWTYSVSPEGRIVPGKISWAGITKTDTETIEVELDNGEVITCTPEHKFILRDGTKIEAQDLVEGSSLMPIYTRENHLVHKSQGREYHQIQQNDTGKWEFTHRTVSEYVTRPQNKNEVIHHVDFNRYNNNPENLQLMDKQEHYIYHKNHSHMVWTHGNYEEHCRKLSESGKAFFETEAGQKRKEEISAYNKICPEIIAGATKGLNSRWESQTNDKLVLTSEEYKAKWINHLHAGAAVRNEMLMNRKYDYSWDAVCQEIDKVYHRFITNSEMIAVIRNNLYKDMSYKLLKDMSIVNGYENMQDYMTKKYGKSYKRHLAKYLPIINHKVVAVRFTGIHMDVGTLTVDGDNEYHDYHNYALAAGIFVMNSKATEFGTLASQGTNAGAVDEIEYTKKQLLEALNVPVSRLESSMFSMGRNNEISRDEARFSKFINRLRMKFNDLFDSILSRELVLTGVMSIEDWDQIKQDIHYDYLQDNYFTELVEADILANRIGVLTQIEPYIGIHYSNEYVRKYILRQTDEEIKEIQEQIKKEVTENPEAHTSAEIFNQTELAGKMNAIDIDKHVIQTDIDTDAQKQIASHQTKLAKVEQSGVEPNPFRKTA